MEIVYTTNHSLAGLHYFSALASWLIVLGAVYGLLRLIFDIATTPIRRRRRAKIDALLEQQRPPGPWPPAG